MVYLCMAFEKQGYYKDDSVAQQVEHIPFKDGVLGSSPSWVTINAAEVSFAAFFILKTKASHFAKLLF